MKNTPTAIFIALIVGVITGMTIWTDRTLDFWMTYAKGAPVDVPGWLSFIMTIILNGAMMLVNILTELFRLVL
jgi:hypothetical protein